MAARKEPDPKRLFKKIVCDYDSRVKLCHPDLLQYFGNLGSAARYFRRYPEYFGVFEDDDGNPQIVGAKLKDMVICMPYAIRRRGYRCVEPDCPLLHLCRDHVGGYCMNGMNCDRNHNLNTDSNMRVLGRLGLLDTQPPYPEEKLMALLRMSLPQVCNWYNNLPDCPNGSACVRFHLCKSKIIRVCENPDCCKAHNLKSPHTQRLLKTYNLEGKTFEELRDAFIIHKVMPKGDIEVAQIQTAKFLDQLRRRPFARGVDFPDDILMPSFVEKQPDKLLFNSEEIEAIQNAMGETDLTDFFINQQLAESQVEIFGEKEKRKSMNPAVPVNPFQRLFGQRSRRLNPVKADQPFLCEAFEKGNCSDAKCKDKHFVGTYLWQVEIGGHWADMNSVNDELEAYYNKGQKNYVTQVPLEAEHDIGELVMIEFRPAVVGKILHNNTKVRVRRLEKRPCAAKEPPVQKLTKTPKPKVAVPSILKGNSRLSFAADKPQPSSMDASAAAVSWQICFKNVWLPLNKASEEIEQAFQRGEEEYITEVPVQCGTELVAINLKNNVAILLSDSSMCEMRRQVSHDVPKTVKSPKQTDLSELLSIDEENKEEINLRVDDDDDVGVDNDNDDEASGAGNGPSQTPEWQWQWRNDELKWEAYHKKISEVLERQYRNGKKTCHLKVNGEEWLVNYLAETQENKTTNQIHHIRRVNN